MLRLSGFADEISPNLDEQIRVCRECGVTHFELRGVYGRNVMDFDAALRQEIKTKLADNSLGVISIGSPIGKVKINESWEAHFDRFKKAVELAEYFAAPLIRIFSYYPPEPIQDVRKNRDEVMRRMRAKVEYIRNRPVTLVHENEKDIYGDKGVHCLDLMKTVNDPKLRCAFDFANFVQVGEDPAVNWPLLKPYTTHIHVKDAVMGAGNIVLTGKGDGKIEPILVDAYRSGYRGFLTLEPHLRVAGHSHGETGPDLFKVAADTLRELLRRNGIELARA
ncbi:MAG: sugar phosphate isomerase/epimerase family protein [Tepidisphaerales bacterium]